MKDLINYGGLIVGLVLASVSLVYTFRPRPRHARPVWKYQSMQLIEGDLGLTSEGVQVLCDGVAVPRLTKTDIVFWNHGENTIWAKHVQEPIQCWFSEDTQVIKVIPLAGFGDSSRLKVNVNPPRSNRLLLEFHYLDQGHGGKIAVLHTGLLQEPKFTGVIAEVPRGIQALVR
jgi:hypothetical protein